MIPNISISSAMQNDVRFCLYRRINKRIVDIEFHEKAKEVTTFSSIHKEALKKWCHQLDKHLLIHHTNNKNPFSRNLRNGIAKGFNKLGTAEEHLTRLFGRYLKPSGRHLTVVEKIFMEQVGENGKKVRVSDLQWRLVNAIEEAARKKWFIVFQTLTIAPGNEEKVFGTSSDCWSGYINDLDRRIGRELYFSVRESERQRANGNLHHKYFAVVERGSVGGRLHIHVVHMCKVLPEPCRRDPNKGRTVPNHRCINKFGHWPYGFSRPIAVRMDANDAYACIGWRWPVGKNKSEKEFHALEAKPALALALYVSKYISKSYHSGKKGLFRCRMTRKLGMGRIDDFLSMLDNRTLSILVTMRDGAPFRKKGSRPPPMTLLRETAATELISRMNSRTVWRYLKALPQAVPLLEQFRIMTTPKQRCNLRSTGSLQTKSSTEMGTSNDFRNIRTAWFLGEYDPSGKPVRGAVHI